MVLMTEIKAEEGYRIWLGGCWEAWKHGECFD